MTGADLLLSARERDQTDQMVVTHGAPHRRRRFSRRGHRHLPADRRLHARQTHARAELHEPVPQRQHADAGHAHAHPRPRRVRDDAARLDVARLPADQHAARCRRSSLPARCAGPSSCGRRRSIRRARPTTSASARTRDRRCACPARREFPMRRPSRAASSTTRRATPARCSCRPSISAAARAIPGDADGRPRTVTVISDLGVLETGAVGRLRSTSYISTRPARRSNRATGLRPRLAPDATVAAPPSAEELRLLDEVIDPRGLRFLEALTGGARRSACARWPRRPGRRDLRAHHRRPRIGQPLCADRHRHRAGAAGHRRAQFRARRDGDVRHLRRLQPCSTRTTSRGGWSARRHRLRNRCKAIVVQQLVIRPLLGAPISMRWLPRSGLNMALHSVAGMIWGNQTNVFTSPVADLPMLQAVRRQRFAGQCSARSSSRSRWSSLFTLILRHTRAGDCVARGKPEPVSRQADGHLGEPLVRARMGDGQHGGRWSPACWSRRSCSSTST